MGHVLDDSLYEKQLKLERESASEGIARYRMISQAAIKRGEGAKLKAVERLLIHWFNPLRYLIAAEKKAITEGRPGVGRGKYGPMFLQFPSSRIALATLHETMNLVLRTPHGVSPVKLSLAVARNLNAQMNYRKIRRGFNAGRRLHKQSGATEPYKNEVWEALIHTHRRRITIKNTNRIASRFEPATRWPIPLQTKIGGCCMELLFRVATVNDYDKPFEAAFVRYNRPKARVFLSEKCKHRINDGHDFRETLKPRYQPMVVPPIEWKHGPGGYFTLPTSMIKNYGRNKSVASDTVNEAVDAVGSTPWRVNMFILDVIKKLTETGGHIAGIPRLKKLPFSPKPANSAL